MRYFFGWVAGLPEGTISSSLAFGGAIHAAIELWFNEQMAGGPVPDHDELLAAFWESWRQRNKGVDLKFSKGEDLSSIGHLADRVLLAFRESELSRPQGTVVGVEEQRRGEIVPSIPDLLARIDLLVLTKDALVITDFKISRSRWKVGQAQDQGEQLLLYSELVRQLAPGKQVKLEFAVISKTKSPVAERHPVCVGPTRIARTKNLVQRIWQAIEAEHFYPAPSPMTCPAVRFASPVGTGLAEAAVRAN